MDAGLSIKQIRKRNGFSVSDAAGCLLSHGHITDHAKGIKDFLKAAVNCYMLQSTADHINVSGHHRVRIVQPEKVFEIGTWRIYPFSAEHDIPCLGFMMATGNSRVLYLTDSAYVKPTFIGLTHVLIEANFDLQTLNENIYAGLIEPFEKKRIMSTHFGLDNLLEFFKANDLSKLKEIHILHLSSRNSNEQRIFDAVTAAVPKGVKVIICEE